MTSSLVPTHFTCLSIPHFVRTARGVETLLRSGALKERVRERERNSALAKQDQLFSTCALQHTWACEPCEDLLLLV
jgi:hypothetical protein